MHQLPDQPQELTRVFVYGTLKPGESNYHAYCAAKVMEAKTAIARGQLFALPFGYPAMSKGNSQVQGYLLTFSDPTILQQLDWLEDYDAHRPEADNEYSRQLAEIYAPDSTPCGKAWVYLMTLERVAAMGGVLLPHGCWSGARSVLSYYADLG